MPCAWRIESSSACSPPSSTCPAGGGTGCVPRSDAADAAPRNDRRTRASDGSTPAGGAWYPAPRAAYDPTPVIEAHERAAQATDDAALRAIVQGVEAETGDRFFASLVRHLASALGVAYAFVTELSADKQRFRTLAVWGRGRFLDDFEVPVAGTPCEAVLNGEMSHHPERLCQLFPEDTGLLDWGAESYCGVPLIDPDGGVSGHLAIFDDKPMRDGPRGIAIMRIFAARARAEIERLHAAAALRASEERLARILQSAMDAIVTFDDALRVELFNEAAEKAFGVPATQALGGSLERFLGPEFAGALASAMTAARGGAAPYVWAPGGLSARRADGGTFPVETTLSSVEVGGRRLFTLILRDVDQRRRAEEELRRLSLQNAYLQEEIKATHNVDEIVGQSRALTDVLDQVRLVASTDSSVLLLGETGTGKELVARAVHLASARRDRPLIKVNCAALPVGLIESELFGHEKGAFTGANERRIGRFELASGGTIFLDEIGELPLETQVKLLRVLQEREFERLGGRQTLRVDVRVIAATNRDLPRAIAEGTFRQDLYYRLNVFPVRIPPLRERREDIPLLVHYFTRRFAGKIGRPVDRVPRETMDRLVAYPWPGNVRELENVIERAVILSTGAALEVAPELLPVHAFAPTVSVSTAGDARAVAAASTAQDARAGSAPASTADPADVASGAIEDDSLEAIERRHIVAALRETGWRIDGPNGAARVLELNPSTLRSRMKKLGIRRSTEVT
ncbi:sigma 54-interacting transcriptional regulator [Candidatus Binatia bacterium]|nr:sigma 54-interacting transcriptional regulator [Candidatus Binatia bacterium]